MTKQTISQCTSRTFSFYKFQITYNIIRLVDRNPASFCTSAAVQDICAIRYYEVHLTFLNMRCLQILTFVFAADINHRRSSSVSQGLSVLQWLPQSQQPSDMHHSHETEHHTGSQLMTLPCRASLCPSVIPKNTKFHSISYTHANERWQT